MAKKKTARVRQGQKDMLPLSFWQTVQLGFYGVPDFKRGLVYIIIGLLIVTAARFMHMDNTVNFIALVGCLISFAGFDQISKIIAGIRTATWDDYNKVVILREMESLDRSKH